MKLIPKRLYKKILEVMPIITVDGIIMHNGKFLLLKRANKPLQGEYWTPGGRIYKGEHLAEGFKRKMLEEIGLKVRVISVVGFYEDFYKDNNLDIEMVHTMSVVFLAEVDKYEIKMDSQSTDYKWVKRLPKRLRILLPFRNLIE
jgi:ADP-ribose pyrophosphatase YjhB (NUDIX family)